jgi:DNA-binding response OmpR family regulator
MNIACYIRNDKVLEHVRIVLPRAGMQIHPFDSENALLRTLSRQSFDLVLIDVPVEPLDDDTILTWLNCRAGNPTPVLIISPVRNAFVTALVLNCGADDFLVRPFEPVELIARIHAAVRRSDRKHARRVIELGGFSLERTTSTFTYQGTPIELTPREFSMAWLFFSAPGVYISRDTISTAIWSTRSEITGRAIEQLVYKLRKKLQLGPERGVILRTAYSQGYRLELLTPAG